MSTSSDPAGRLPTPDDPEGRRILDDFFADAGPASRRVLMLDYDGTLAPFTEDRNRAVPYPDVRRLLKEIRVQSRTRLVVVSGRSLDDLIPLLGLDPPPELWGSHGWERIRSGGQRDPVDVSQATRALLDDAARAALDRVPLSQVERKPASTAIHVRGLDASEGMWIVRDLRLRWGTLVERSEGDIEIHAFDGGLEVRAAGRTKGDAVRTILAEEGEAPVAAFLGDDRTDEDAFAALPPSGLPVLVRNEYRPTLARLWLRPLPSSSGS